jgi:hypothetical protein
MQVFLMKNDDDLPRHAPEREAHKRGGLGTKQNAAARVCVLSQQASKQASTEVPAVIRMEGYDRVVRQAESL